MRERKRVVFSVLFAALLQISHGCQIDGVIQWGLPIQTRILDTHEGLVESRGTTYINGISNVSSGQATIGGPYFEVSLVNSQLLIVTNDAYRRYEEIEVSSRVSLTIDFNCSGGSSNSIIVWIDITDTNNNAPEFIPTGVFEFTVAPPLPPGFSVTGCLSDITVRDIDLTTSRIDFTIEDNPYFEIEYDEESSTVAKEFKAQLRTKTFIRSLSEPITLTITATDVDETQDPPLSTTAIVRILADTEFQFPEEPVFGQTFYLANYTEDHQLNLLATISLQQGFDEYVKFTLEGEYYTHFELITNGNEVSIDVTTPLPDDIWLEGQVLLIVRAEREFTSGDTTTVVVQLPKEIPLLFESVYYQGDIINNGLELSPLVLSQGYEGRTVSAEIVGEFSSYFTASVQGHLVTVTMMPLSDDIIDQNSFISVPVVAKTDRSETTTVVNLDIIKDDNVTPVFDKSIYSGSYNPQTGLNADQIILIQGFDDTVTLNITGEHADYFQYNQNGAVITLTSSTIPPELYSEQNILISIEAIKPRTVGANAAIYIALPAARELEFEESTYRGTIQGNQLDLQTILLSNGYEESVNFDVSGEYSIHFTATNTQDRVTVALSDPLPDTAITQNSVIMLTLTASGLNAITTSTTILLDVINDDTTTPSFFRDIYYGTYSGVALDVEEISLQQGFDSGVTFRLDGENSEYFQVTNNGNNVAITLQYPIPEDLIFRDKVLVFNVIADKALTVGANAAVLIRFPTELTDSTVMRFSKNTYVGTFEDNEISLENIVLDTGFAVGTQFFITGDHAEHFSLSDTSNVVQVTSLRTLPNHVVEENDFIVLGIEARRERAVSVWTSVVVDIVKQEVIVPVFGQAYYTGLYTEQGGLTFAETINLSEGYDDTVTFSLSGELSTWFLLNRQGNALTLVLRTPVPVEILGNNNQLLFTVVANNPAAADVAGRAVISIDLPKDFTDSSFRFQQDFYEGTFENGNINLDEIILGDYTNEVNYQFTGDYADNFQLTNQNGIFTLRYILPLSTDVLERTNAFVFTLVARNANIRTHTILIIENIRAIEEVPILEFEEPYYVGAYSESELLQFDSVIRLTNEIDENIAFDVEGVDSEWFGLERNGNSVTLTLTGVIPAAVLANNQQLVFVVTAQRPGSATARATVVIALIDEFPVGSNILGFDRVSYLGSIENNQASIQAITLSEGFMQGVVFTLLGDLADYFILSPQGAVVTVALQGPIPVELIPANRIILLTIQATAPEAMTAHASIVFEMVDEGAAIVVELIFAQTFYSGSYSSAAGLTFSTPLSLAQGYDADVDFNLEGEHAQWFGLERNGNSVTVTLTGVIPAVVLANNQQLVFVVTAQRPGSATARATVVIALIDEFPVGSNILGFDRVSYLGSIENNQASIQAITLSEGFTQGVVFTLLGDLADYFILLPQGAVVTVALRGPIPVELIPANRIILLTIQATAPEAMTAHASIVFEVVDEGAATMVELIFAQTFYSGSYSSAAGLTFSTPLSLAQGYDADVDFNLEGEHAQWFGLERNGNSVTVTLTGVIPAAVLANNQQLVFVVTAQRPGSATARATVVIALIDEFPVGSNILGFDRVSYLGFIENNQASIQAITLSEGFTQGVVFTLLGDLADYFILSPQGAVVTVALRGPIPVELIPANRIILLTIQATAPEAMTAHASIVFEVVDDSAATVVELIFAQTFYSGSYSSAAGLTFSTPLSLAQGYDADVDFNLEGEHAQWFGLERNGNSVTVTLTGVIPAAVLANNQQLVFVVTAQRPGSATARATVVIALIDEFPVGSNILGFERVSYLGFIENNQASIQAITLSEGFTQGVVFTLLGDLADYFILSPQGAVVTVALRGPIPVELIPANRIILLTIQATAPEAMTAHASIVFEVVDDSAATVVELIFAQTFYSGSYSSAAGLTFSIPLSLAQGYDADVDFNLEGEHAQWFGLERNGNSVTVTLTGVIPAAVLANNQQLVFVVTAQRPGSATARATVVIALIDEFPVGSNILGFDRVSYLGFIENNQASIQAITLSEGFTQGVVFTLLGDLADYFILSPQGAVVTVALRGPIPVELIPANRIILLTIQATAPEAMTAHASIVFEVVDEGAVTVVELIFAQTFYSGSYSSAAGLTFSTPLSLAQGYDADVDFNLEGEHAQWFGLERNGNSVTVTLTGVIPAAVLANNQQLVFVVTAQRPGSATARATVVIALIDEFPVGSNILGFDRVSYVGFIENNQASIQAITLSEGFTQGVVFTLHGDLADYFILSPQGAVVTVALRGPIPVELIPANRIILLTIQATAPEAMTAHASIVFEMVDEGAAIVVELIFAQTFYSGSYSSAAGLTFSTPLSLAQGYDADVDFNLEGEHAQWFGLERNGNSVTVTLTGVIPAVVLANNQQLVFVVTAQRPGSATARATVVIALIDEFPVGSNILGFDRVSYLGSIENNQASIQAITLSEGFTQGVVFTLLGDLADYFILLPQGAVVTVALRGPIPVELIPANRIILLTIQATAPEAMTAHASIVFEVVDEGAATMVELIFAQTFYSGSYSSAAGLTFSTPLSLAQGYDADVDFNLEGEHAQWFGLERNGNSVTVTLTGVIPAAVLANNQQLVFVVTAQRPGSATARATVVIALIDEFPVGSNILGFDRVSYLGFIENNQASIQAITLSEGFTQGVVFTLLGDLADYFILSPQGAVVTVALRGPIPVELIPANRIILLTIQATAPEAMTAHASIVFEVVDDSAATVVELIFAQTFYSGSYSSAAGLTFSTPLSLAQGYDADVDFNLEGEHAQWFGLERNGNSVTVTLTGVIPAAVLANNQQLVFVVTAQRPGSATARATVVIALIDEFPVGSNILGFERVSYLGFIENNQASIQAITLSEGFTQGVVFTLLGDLADYFILSPQGAVVTVALRGPIPVELIPANRIILLTIQATAPEAMTAHASIVFEVVDDSAATVVELIFAQTFYSGSYSSAAGLTFSIPLSLAQGYDADVDFNLEGEHAQWFGLERNGNSVTVTLTGVIPAAVLANNQQLVFVVTAQRPGSATARATVVIALIDEFPVGSNILGFDRVSYLGFIENNQASIQAITLSEGFTQGVVFTLLGDLADYFILSPQGAVVTVALRGPIPVELIPANRIILLTIQATAPEAMTAHASIVFEVVDEGAVTVVELIFAQTFYSGSYSSAAGLTFSTPLSLAQGYDADVDFNLEGEHAQWFGLERNGNSVTVTLTGVIPAAVLANNQQLVFVVTAQRPGSATARATVVIALIDEFPVGSNILGFDRVSYVGFIENNQASIQAITLSEGFTQGVVFTLHGDLADYFILSPQGAVVTVALRGPIPVELIPANRIILLTIQATAPEAMTAHASIVFEVVEEGAATVVELIFAQTFYSGSYSSAAGLTFSTPLSLAQGYDADVDFNLEGEHAQWFGLERNGNSVTVTLTGVIPAAVLANNQQLVFVVTAQRPGSATARATVVIALIDEFPVGSNILGFDRVSYVGFIENNQASIQAITLSEGFTQGVVFTLHGDLADYFILSPQGAVVTVALRGPIPVELIPANRIILLTIQATAPEAMTAHASIVFEVVDEGAVTVVELIFAQTFYSGSYSSAAGLTFSTPLSLAQGYDADVDFNLEGEHAQWFGLERNGNSVTVTLTGVIPAAVLANNQQLVFVVTAQRPGSATARATVVIALIDEFPVGSNILGFDRVSYVGFIENNQASIQAITLSEGFTQGVVFTLHGDLADYFILSPQGAVVTVALRGPIPVELIPANRIILLTIQATAPEAMTAHASIVFEVVEEGAATVVELIFAQTFYSGSYSSAAGLTFSTPLSLAQGYDADVDFNLEGEHAQWFGLERNGNSVTVTLTGVIPAAVLANNQQLVFVVTAQRPGSATARATVVIALIDEFPVGSNILGFDRVSYVGFIENNQASIQAITLSEGFTQGVVFTLHGDLADYFILSPQGAVVTVALRGPIPVELIPANRIILLTIQATAPEAMTAHASIVFEVVDEGAVTVVELIFAQTFYSGSYSSAAGLTFSTPLSLAQGYDADVDFNLEGEHAQWFGLERNGNSVTVTLTGVIPAAVLANNQQLVFVVTAQRPGSATARATVVIALIDEFPVGSNILGFDRVSYVGFIKNNQASIQAITLSEGFTQGVVFTLHGDLADYFILSPQGAVVTVALRGPIPVELIPANRIILLTIQATAPEAMTAHASIVFEVVEEGAATVVELIFAQTFYSGSYSSAAGLTFSTPLSLAQGYDADVDFNLEGEHAQWFGLERNGNSVTVTLTGVIPAAVLANNQQLVFVVTAQRPGSATARATVVIALIDEFPVGSNILGFDRVSYLGFIENDQASIQAITLSEGFTQGVVFTLLGDLADYFILSPQGAVVTVALRGPIPVELIPANRIILLTIQATAPEAMTAHASIVFEVVDEGAATVVELIFAQTFYSGSYSSAAGLTFSTPLSLAQGYDADVDFNLEGEHAQWFGLERNGNSVTVTLTGVIPAAVLANNQQLVFVVTAQRPGSATARATVVIALIDEFPVGSNILGFDRVSYLGFIENDQASIQAITLSEGFTQGVVFTLLGDLADYFILSPQGAVVTVALRGPIPVELIPANRIILLTIQATAPEAMTAHASIVFEVVDEGAATVVELIFAQTFYSGSYSSAAGLTFSTPLSLAQGYDADVDFNLEGEHAQWFGLERNGNSVTVTLTGVIPAAVLANNQQLVFVVTAQRPGSATARATVVIALIDEFPVGSNILGFDRVSYLGFIENNQASIQAITLSEGFTQGVVFTLLGDLADYFILSPQGAVVTVALRGPIPVELIPTNRIILLTIQATAPEAMTAHASIVFEVVDEGAATVVELIFAQTFYSGSYSSAAGLTFSTPLSLAQGYDADVDFNLEGEHAQWFGLERNGNSVTVTLTGVIPAAVLANNQQLVFVVTAQRPGSATARATVVIALIDEFPVGSNILGFDRVSYLGFIENDQASIQAITLSEGFTQGVVFTLLGDLADYFILSPQGAVVTVALRGPIPVELIPANRIILLTIQATAPEAMTAHASIVFEVVDEGAATVVELIFAQTFYSGSYSSAAGLTFSTPLSLAQGYDADVDFNLEGEHAQWFGLERNGNSVTVTLTGVIPAAVLANNQQLVFVVTAQRPGSATARATVVIALIDEFPVGSNILGFDRVSYLGFIETNQASIQAITLSEGFTQGVVFTLLGDLADYFILSPQGAVVTVALRGPIPVELIPANRIILLTIQATAPEAMTAHASIVFEVVDEGAATVVELIFAQTFYSGSYSSAAGLTFSTPLSLAQGYDADVDFNLEGEHAQWFGLERNGNSVTVTLTGVIPAAVLANNQQLVFVVTAQRPGSATARATVVIALIDEFPVGSNILGFDRVSYLGFIETNQASIQAITLSEGFTQGVVFTLLGDLADYFILSPQGAVVTVALRGPIPVELIPANRIILLTIQATAPEAMTAHASIVFEVVDEGAATVVELIFAQTFYSGSYSSAAGLTFSTPLSLAQGYDADVDFNLEGEHAQWFGLERNGNSVTVTLTGVIPAAVLANNQQLVFVVTAQRPGSATARATVVIALIDEFPVGSNILGFDRVSYLGSIENNQASIQAITLSEGFTQGVVFTLLGDLADYFILSPQGAVVTVALRGPIPVELIPANRIILLTIQATAPEAMTAHASIVFEVVDEGAATVVELIFAQTFYSGSYSSAAGLTFSTPLSLAQGYDADVDFNLEGEHAQWFGLERNGNSVTVTLTGVIPAAVLANNQQLVFVVTAQRPGSATARATVVIALIDDSQDGSDVTFGKVLFEGVIRNGVVNHETITVTGYSGSTVELHGEYSSMFSAALTNGEVTVTASDSLVLPPDATHAVLKMRAGTASAVLVLDVIQTDTPTPPIVTFSSPSYAIQADITHTGLVGQVQASADSGEALTYSLLLDNAHLQERLSINDEGELHLSAPANGGSYTFDVAATTVFTQSGATATVHLSVEAITVCGDELVMPPLIVLDFDEEEPHYDLINGTRYDNCNFILNNRWPSDQTWVYADENGLHTQAIDREHESIAFMAVSQVQVEIILHCEGDVTRNKRSLTSDSLGPYDYGNNNWILTDSIPYNSRRSFVNLIVNDINDNYPIFVGKENEPIAVGYPVPDLAERVLPRSLAELQATDADIGENAALRYWSSASELAVAPTTGFVHLRDGATLENGVRLTVHATDRNGEGLTGSIDILVRLLDESYIAVVTVRNAFLDDEQTVALHLSEAVGYEVKVLRSVVISDEVETEEVDSRKKRDATNSAGASLQLYVYGLIAREPVSVDRLTADISNSVIAPVTIASSVSLQDYLGGQEICVIAGRGVGLLVTTIVLSVVLFILLVLIAVWYFLKWRKNRNYDEFTDANSLASRNESIDKFPRPEVLPKPRLDIGELKKSERRLQEMLDAPIEEVFVEPTSSRNDAILDMPTPEPLTPIVIQSIDKLKDAAEESSDDEFGETKRPKRKSVVTFNENVEKIIHVEDIPEVEDNLSVDPNYEIYKL